MELLAGRSETYNPISTQQQLDRADHRLRDNKYQQKLIKRIGRYNTRDQFTPVDVAAAQLLINDALNEGEYEVAANLISGLSRKGTELGRAVQAFSIMARLTPEGTLRMAQRTMKSEADYIIGEGANEGLDMLADDIADAIEQAESKSISPDEIADRIRHGNAVEYPDGHPYSDAAEAQRYQRLKNRTIKVIQDKSGSIPDLPLAELENKAKDKVEDAIKKMAEKIGVLNREMSTPELDITFELTKGNGLKASLSHQLSYGGNYADFAKALINIDEILQNAVLMEQYADKYAGTYRENKHLINTSVLLGVYQDGESIVPVQFVIKQLRDTPNKLYLTVALTKVETGVMGATYAAELQQTRNLLPISEYSLADLFANINPKDAEFLKYVPDVFLDEGQIVAKKQAQDKEQARIEGYEKKGPTRGELLTVLTDDLTAAHYQFVTLSDKR